MCEKTISTEPNGAAKGHNFLDGKCTICQESDPNYKPVTPPEDNVEPPKQEGGAGSESDSGNENGTVQNP